MLFVCYVVNCMSVIGIPYDVVIRCFLCRQKMQLANNMLCLNLLFHADDWLWRVPFALICEFLQAARLVVRWKDKRTLAPASRSLGRDSCCAIQDLMSLLQWRKNAQQLVAPRVHFYYSSNMARRVIDTLFEPHFVCANETGFRDCTKNKKYV